MADPDFIYDPESWDVTYEWASRSDIDEDHRNGKPRRFRTLVHGPDKWAARVVITRDDDGDSDETEIQWFDSEAEALAAVETTDAR